MLHFLTRAVATVSAGVLLVAGASGLLAEAPPRQATGQAPQVTFKVETNYVEVTAVVVDQQGRFVDTLQRDDFQVFEDGKPQTVTSFVLVNMANDRPERALFTPEAIEPDVRSNAQPFDGRVYLLVLDDLHTDFADTRQTKQAAKAFVETALRAGDLAAVVSTSGRTDASQDFTPSRRLLLAAIDRFMGRGLSSATGNAAEDYNNRRDMLGPKSGASPTAGDSVGAERAQNARATLSSLRGLSELMAGVRGRRKALVLFSGGIAYNVANAIASGWSQDNERESRLSLVGSGPIREVQMDTIDTIAAATRANVAIYGVDPRGLTIAGGAGTAGLPTDAAPSMGLNMTSMQGELGQQHDSLQVLADGSGGFAAFATNNLSAVFDRIRQDNSRYYVLGYYPTNDKRDGKFRTIDVRVARPGLQVQARKGYVAPRGNSASGTEMKPGTLAPAVQAALASPVPVSGLRMTAFAAPFRRTPPAPAAVTLVLHVDGRDLTFKEQGGTFNGALDLSVVALDSQGKTHGLVQRHVPMPLRPESYQMVLARGMRIVSQIDLAPGRYQLRIAAMDAARAQAGTVLYDLDVPDFAKLPFSMSGLVLTSSQAGAVPTAGGSAVDDLRGVLPGPPTVSREFKVGEELALLAEVYETSTDAAHTIDITTTLRTDTGQEVFRQEDHRASAELQAGGGTSRYTARVPLKDAPPGLYVLRVEARSRLHGSAVVRDVQFRIVP
jgi:VWFA-related protein